jgi:PPOX class probable F420-dependent enzyme
MEIPQGALQRLLDSWPVARLATRGPEFPHQVPIVFARAGGRFWSPVDGKPKSGGELARVRHVQADPRVSLLLDEYGEDWAALWWIRVEGLAEVVSSAEPTRDLGMSAAVVALRGKYPQYEEIPVLREPPTALVIEPLRIASWCAGPRALGRAEAHAS